MAATGSTSKPTFLSLPPEIRLMIYNYLVQDRLNTWRYMPLVMDKNTTLIRHGASCLAPLNQICRKVQGETRDMFNTRLTTILVTPGEALRQPVKSSITTIDDWSGMAQMQRVHLHVTVNATNTREQIDSGIKSARQALSFLAQSSQLRSSSCIVAMLYESEEFRRKRRLVRRTTARDGFKMGRSAVQRELDFALKAMELLEERNMSDFLWVRIYAVAIQGTTCTLHEHHCL